jgi:hypothetical protein
LSWNRGLSREEPIVRTFAKVATVAGLAAAAGYPLAVRPWLLRWGATAQESTQWLPGDDIVPRPRTTSTRAITIDADARDVWPWLVQLGQGRGGLYSYDRLENLFGYDIHSVDRVVPELQRLAPGDRIRLVPEKVSADIFLEVAAADPDEALVLRGPGTPGEAFAAGMGYPSWAFVIRPAGPHRVRLLARWRCDFEPSLRATLAWKYGIEPVHFIMERKMLHGIRIRAQALHRARTRHHPVRRAVSGTSPPAQC